MDRFNFLTSTHRRIIVNKNNSLGLEGRQNWMLCDQLAPS